MKWIKKVVKDSLNNALFHRYVKFRSSIYGRVVIIITISLFFLFIAFAIIFRSVNEQYMGKVIRENGNNIGYLVEGALYRSMLENDRTSLQSTLDRINLMSGIEDVNMYDHNDDLVYSSISDDTTEHTDPNCKSCHANFASMFSHEEKSYRIIDVESECTMNHNNSDNRYLVIKSPVLNSKSCYESSCHAHDKDSKVLGSLIITMPLKTLDEALEQSTTDYFLMAAIMTSLLVFFLILFTKKTIREPLFSLINASIAVANGDKKTRLAMPSNQLSDMRMVSTAFNNMLDNLEAANIELQNWSKQLEYKVRKKTEELGQAHNELINIERIASLGKLSLSVAHEINNPLSGILIYSKLIYKQISNQDIDPAKKESMLKHLRLIETETKRCGDIVKGLLDFSRKDQNNFEPKHLHEILADTYDLMSHPMKIANIHFISDFCATDDYISCSANQIKQACVAMLVNASEAVSDNGEIVFRTTNPDTDHILIEISDNGTGIREEDIPHIFEPFFTTKENASGIGLGLAIVHGLISNHRGKIDVISGQGKGTKLLITLPLIQA